MQSNEIVQSLEDMRARVKERLTDVREYRVFAAIQQSINDIPDLHEVVAALNTAHAHIRNRLDDVREYRALNVLERSIADLNEVADVLLACSPVEATAVVILENAATADEAPQLAPVEAMIVEEPAPAAASDDERQAPVAAASVDGVDSATMPDAAAQLSMVSVVIVDEPPLAPAAVSNDDVPSAALPRQPADATFGGTPPETISEPHLAAEAPIASPPIVIEPEAAPSESPLADAEPQPTALDAAASVANSPDAAPAATEAAVYAEHVQAAEPTQGVEPTQERAA